MTDDLAQPASPPAGCPMHKPPAHDPNDLDILRRLVTDANPSQVFMVALMDAVSDAVFVVSVAGEIVLVNARAVLLSRYSREELIGQKIEMLVPQRVEARHAALRDGFFNDPSTRTLRPTSLTMKRKCGAEIEVNVALLPFVVKEGIYTVAVVSLRPH